MAHNINATNAYIEAVSTITVEAALLESFSIKFEFGALSGYIDANGNVSSSEIKMDVGMSTYKTIRFTLPKTFYDEIPTTTGDWCTLTCRFYNIFSQTGEMQTRFKASTNPTLCRPTLTYRILDVNEVTKALVSSSNTFVRFESRIQCTLRAASKNGASLTRLRIHNWQAPSTSSGIVTYTLKDPDFDTIVFFVEDSRGYTTTVEVPITLIPYIPLVNNTTAQRTDPTSGNIVVQLQGLCWNGSFDTQFNTLNYEIDYLEGQAASGTIQQSDDNTYALDVPLSGFDYTQSHKIHVTVSDAVKSVPLELTINKGIPVFDWGENDFKFNVPVDVPALSINGISLEEYIRSIVEGG